MPFSSLYRGQRLLLSLKSIFRQLHLENSFVCVPLDRIGLCRRKVIPDVTQKCNPGKGGSNHSLVLFFCMTITDWEASRVFFGYGSQAKFALGSVEHQEYVFHSLSFKHGCGSPI